MSRKLLTILICGALAAIAFSAADTEANGGRRNDWKAAYPNACAELVAAANDCSLCHFPDDSFRSYAQDYITMGESWVGIEGEDSDDDGRTNGEEINQDCTLPGDSTSPTQQDSWAAIKALYGD